MPVPHRIADRSGPRSIGDQAVFVHRQLWDQVGGFPEVQLMEDVRLAMELRLLQPPELLAGPVNVDARRWQKRGVAKQTWLNWRIQWAHFRGVPEETLRDWYR
ncbi:MAG: hypothetical protein AAF958_03665 [Planctomycetota bacterium]